MTKKQNIEDKSLSSKVKDYCDCCEKVKMVRMYVLQNGETAFVCKTCRAGK